MALTESEQMLVEKTLGVPTTITPAVEGVIEASVVAESETTEPTAEQTTEPIEAKPEEVKLEEEKKPEEDSKLSARFASLARKEKMLSQREKELKIEKQRTTTLQDEVKNLKEVKDLYEKDPFAAFEKMGIKPEELARKVLELSAEPEAPTVDTKISALERSIEDLKSQNEQYRLKEQISDNERRVNEAKKTIIDQLQGRKEEFEIITSQDRFEEVFDTMSNYFEKHKERCSWEDAAKAVEAFHEEQYQKYSTVSKFKPKTPEPKVETEIKVESKPEVSSTPKAVDKPKVEKAPTITASMTTTAATPIDTSSMSRSEEIEYWARKLLRPEQD